MTLKTFISQTTCAALCVATVVLLPTYVSGDQPNARGGPKSDPLEKHALAIKGEFETAILVLPPFPSFPPGPFQPILHLLITADGNLSHLGKATAATTDQAVDLSVIPNRGTAHWAIQNSKGDALWTEMDLSGTPPDATGSTEFHGTLTVIGGSGKFEGATGLIEFQGSAQGDSGFFSLEGIVWVNKGR